MRSEQLLTTSVEAQGGEGKVRADTTVVSVDVNYPTDSGLLASAVVKIYRLIRRTKTVGAATRTTCRDRSHAAARSVRTTASILRCAARQLARKLTAQ
ncbi:hypothetical protein [Dactylosporangium darangshiense]|uniref:Uncharacterized protein n=1 Tax=Dactylosporangium darangshiense TaxID=579108 RepID=A0ABP8DU73_9ACTN